MSMQTWFFIGLAVMAIGRLVRSLSADPLRPTVTPPRRAKIVAPSGQEKFNRDDRSIGPAAGSRPSRVTCYLRKGTVYVATFGRAQSGVDVMVKPIAAVSLGKIDELRMAIKEGLSLSNPVLQVGPSAAEEDRHALLVLADAESWTDFDRSSTGRWSLIPHNDAFEIISSKNYSKKGGWVKDLEVVNFLPAGTTLDAACDRLLEIMRAAVPPESGILEPRIPSAVETLQASPEPDSSVVLPDSPYRVDELADFLEWIANVEPEEAPTIRSEIKRYYYDHGDTEGGDALTQALEEALVATDPLERAKILDRFERYVQEDWVTANWTSKT